MLKIFQYLEKYYLNIYLLGFLFYICRAVFPPFKYLFAVFALISVIIFLAKDLPRINLIYLKYLLLPLILAVFYFIGLLNSQSFYDLALKEASNIVILFFYGLVFSMHFRAINYRFFKWSTLALLFIGVIAIIRFLLMLKGIAIPFNEYISSSHPDKFSLVSDSNYYSLYFIFCIGLSFYLKSKNRISLFYYLLSNTVFLVNIILCFSRRGYLVLLFVILLLPLTLLIKDAKVKPALLSFYSLIGVWLFLSLISVYAFRFQIYKFDIRTSIISNNLHNLNSIFGEDNSVLEFNRNLWERVSDEYWSKYRTEQNNLYYNGDFRYDLEFWSYVHSSNDSVSHEIKSEGNNKYLEVSRLHGDSFLQLVYYGRPIYFHKNVNYKLSFDFRVVNGEGIPFRVGWWVLDNGERPYKLPMKVTSLADGWKHCEVVHAFKEDQVKPKGFINGMKAGAIINIRDISLTPVDSVPEVVFSDQIPEVFVDDTGRKNSNALFNRRVDMWQYSLQLWMNEYVLVHKTFGKGFDYLPVFGEKFNDDPGRYTYPHNPILSAFLYSGFIGGVFYMFFLIVVFWMYWQYRGELFLVFSLYVLAFIFTMFSGNSHFSVHIFAFLSFIPFIYKFHINYQRENKDLKLGKYPNDRNEN